MNKKTVRNILIGVAVALVILLIIVFSILLRKDANGLNAFDRNKVVASAAGESITMREYAMAMSNSLSYYTYYGMEYTDEELKTLQENVASQLLLHKVMLKKVDELGLSLTPEELAQCKKTAEDQLTQLEESIGSQMATSGNYSNASVQSQINDYFTTRLGMTKAQYKSFIEMQEKAEIAEDKLTAYYESETQNYTDADLLAYYDKFVTENYADNYEPGTYSMQMYMYMIGYNQVPFLYVPENYIYVDVLSYTAGSEEDAKAFEQRFKDGEDFDTLAAADGVTTAHDMLKAPYAIGEADWGYVLGSADVYTLAQSLEVGQTDSTVIQNTTTATDGTETESSNYTVYVVKRVDGTFCENGAASGIVDIDYYDGVRDQVKSSYESTRFGDLAESWLTDKQLSDAIYTFAG